MENVNYATWSIENLATLLVGLLFGWKAEETTTDTVEYNYNLDAVLLTCPGVGERLCAALIRALDGPVTLESLLAIPGVGPKRAQNILKHLQENSDESAQDALEAFFFEQVDRNYSPGEKVFQFAELDDNPHAPPTTFWVEGSQFGDVNPYLTRGREDADERPLAEQADETLTAAGFEMSAVASLTDEDISVWYTRKSSGVEAKKRERKFHQWCRWITRNSTSHRLREGWNTFWKQYYTKKGNGTLESWLTSQQVSLLVGLFGKYGMKAK